MTVEAEVEDLPDYMGAAKDVREAREPLDADAFDGAFLETTCPSCGKHVSAFIVDGPDPVFADLVCPRDECGHEWSERVA